MNISITIQIDDAHPEAVIAVLTAVRQTGGAAKVEHINGANGAQGAGDAPWCPIHSVQMEEQQNERGKWFSHQTHDNGWCKGK